MDFEDIVSLKFNLNKEKVKKVKILIKELANIPDNALLVGGTAINLVYFGKMQRLSYDIDLETKNRKKLREIFSQKYKKIAFTKRMDVFEKDGIKLDIMDYLGGKVVEKNVESLFTLVGIPMYLKVKTLEFEELLARKFIALSNRGTAKDLYDCYVGVLREHDLKKVKSAILRIKKNFHIPLKKYVDLDLSKVDSVLLKVSGEDAFALVESYLINLFD